VTCRSFVGLGGDIRVEGAHNVPTTGSAIVVCNHTKGHDYFPLGSAAPRQIFFMVKEEAFLWNKWLGKFLTEAGCFPVNRGAGDLAALQSAADVVNAGRLLGMFPEGHRSEDGTLQRGLTGATRVALMTRAPIVPAAVIGAEAGIRNFPRFWKRPRVTVRFGEPFMLEGDVNDRRSISTGTRRIMTEIALLLPPEMRGKWTAEAAEAEALRGATGRSSTSQSAATTGNEAFQPHRDQNRLGESAEA
jgi:1-acyl-sn-glycerol-3-phosphate acyltransferase